MGRDMKVTILISYVQFRETYEIYVRARLVYVARSETVAEAFATAIQSSLKELGMNGIIQRAGFGTVQWKAIDPDTHPWWGPGAVTNVEPTQPVLSDEDLKSESQ